MTTALIRLLLGWGGFCVGWIASTFLWSKVIHHANLYVTMGGYFLTMMALNFGFGTVLRAQLRWPKRDFNTGYGAMVLTIWSVVSLFSRDFIYLDIRHYLRGLFSWEILGLVLAVALLIAIPWFSGFAIGDLILCRRERREACKVSSIGSDRGNTVRLMMRYRASKEPYIVFSIIFGGGCLLPAYSALTHGGDGWTVAVMFGCALVFVIIWLAVFEIRFDQEELIFRDLFSGTRRIKLTDIKIIRLAWEWGEGNRGPLRLIVEPIPHSGLQPFAINAKVFSREAVQSVLNLGKRVASADDGGLIDGVVKKLYRAWRASKRKDPSGKASAQ